MAVMFYVHCAHVGFDYVAAKGGGVAWKRGYAN